MTSSDPPRSSLRQPLVKFGPPCGKIVSRRGGRLEIGTVIWDDGAVEVIPRHEIADDLKATLRRAGEEVWMMGPPKGWLYNPSLGWIGCACVDQSEFEELRSSSSAW